jgi:pimeloyl-ACP methyl ester carboxylesterase
MMSGVFLVLALAVAQTAADAHPDTPVRVRFGLADGNHAVGFHYWSHRSDLPVLLMIHGASDTHTVFDFAPRYRAAPQIARHGYPVLALDRVGYGESSRPDGDTLNFTIAAGYVHEVIQALWAGALDFVPRGVVLLGPSVGADLTIVEAGTYRDVDGVIVCFHTAQLQPEIFQVDVGAWFAQGPYFDFGVDFRTRFFYTPPFAEQRIIDLDNATRSLVPRAELQSALNNASAPFRAQVMAPVLLLQADHDHIFIPQDDSNLFSGSPDVTYALLEDAGHKAFQHKTSRHPAVHTILEWLDDRFRAMHRSGDPQQGEFQGQ